VADIVPLHGENRIFVKHGLTRLANTTNPGLQALIKVSGISKDFLGTSEVGFRIAPRLNAVGRIGNPDLAIRLLLTDNIGEAWELANELHQGNQLRQEIESAVLEDALRLLDEQPSLAEGKVIVLFSDGWHPGVIGIVASRLVERFYRPVLLISIDGGLGRGSARSIPGFNIYKALSYCQEYLVSFGRHALAAGFSILAGRIGGFSNNLKTLAPDREYLASVYMMLRRKANSSGCLALRLPRVVRALEETGFSYNREFTVKIALKILMELGLLLVGGKGKLLEVNILPPPREKQDLSGSRTYLRLQQIKDDSTAWMRKLLKEPVNNIFRLFTVG